MKITQNLVELLNAKLNDLIYEVSMFNGIELAEDMGLTGTDLMTESLLDVLSNRFNKNLKSSEDAHQALEVVKNQLRVTIQLDYLAKEFKSIGADEKLTVNMEILKEKNLKELMRVLKVDESEVE